MSINIKEKSYVTGGFSRFCGKVVEKLSSDYIYHKLTFKIEDLSHLAILLIFGIQVPLYIVRSNTKNFTWKIFFSKKKFHPKKFFLFNHFHFFFFPCKKKNIFFEKKNNK